MCNCSFIFMKNLDCKLVASDKSIEVYEYDIVGIEWPYYRFVLHKFKKIISTRNQNIKYENIEKYDMLGICYIYEKN